MANTHYFFIKHPEAGEKLAPQAQIILGHIEKAGKAGIERKQLNALVDEDIKNGVFTSVQSGSKLVGFYQNPMSDRGFIKFEVSAPAPKPAKVKAAKFDSNGDERPTIARKKAEAVA